jgi:trimethylamine--corrinoid protein Co-methyltransferase
VTAVSAPISSGNEGLSRPVRSNASADTTEQKEAAMTHGHYHLFDRRSLAMLHRAALTVLADTGIEMHHEGALQVLTGAGCRVDADRRIARFPAALVKKALRTAPREVILRRADGTPVRLGGDEVHFVPGTSAIELIESGTTHRRSPTCRDTVEFLRLADALDHIGLGAAFGIASDCPAEFWDRYRVYLELKTCAKPSVAGAFTFGAVPEMVRLMDAAGGGDTAAARHRVVVFG